MNRAELRVIICGWDNGDGFDDAVERFARRIGYHRRTVQRWLAGEYQIRPLVAERIKSLPKNAKPVKPVNRASHDQTR